MRKNDFLVHMLSGQLRGVTTGIRWFVRSWDIFLWGLEHQNADCIAEGVGIVKEFIKDNVNIVTHQVPSDQGARLVFDDPEHPNRVLAEAYFAKWAVQAGIKE